MISSSCLWLAQERGYKTKITELMVYGYWVVMGSLERVNPKPNPSDLATEKERERMY